MHNIHHTDSGKLRYAGTGIDIRVHSIRINVVFFFILLMCVIATDAIVYHLMSFYALISFIIYTTHIVQNLTYFNGNMQPLGYFWVYIYV